MATVTSNRVVQITNIAPQATRDQMQTLFGYLGKIDDIRLYPTVRDVACPVQSRICYVKFQDSTCVSIAQHMTNTVFIDRALIVIPFQTMEIPDEQKALELTNNGTLVPGLFPAEPKLPPNVVNQIEGMHPNQVVTTHDPRLVANGLPLYPPLSASLDARRIEEVRRTLLVSNLDDSITALQLIDFFAESVEVKYIRFCNRDEDSGKYCLVELSDQNSIIAALQLNGRELAGKVVKIYHATQAIVKPQAKTNEAAQREIEEAMSRVKEAQNLISAAIDPVIGMLAKEKKRSRSRSRRSRSPSHGSRRSRRSRSRSRRSSRRSRSRSRGSRSKRTRSKSRERKVKDRSPGHSSRSIRSRSSSRRRSRSRSRRSHSKSKSKSSRTHEKSRDSRKDRDDKRDRRDDRKDRKTDVKKEKEKEKEDTSKEDDNKREDSKHDTTSVDNVPIKTEPKEKDVEKHKEKRSKESSRDKSYKSKSSRDKSRSRSPPHKRSHDSRRRSKSPSRSNHSKHSPSKKSGSPSRSRKEEKKKDKERNRDEKDAEKERKKREKKEEKEKENEKASLSKVPRNYDEEEEGFDTAEPEQEPDREQEGSRSSQSDGDYIEHNASDAPADEKDQDMEISTSP